MTTKSKKAPESDAAPAPPEPSEGAAGGREPAPEPGTEPAASESEDEETATELERELAVYPVREAAADPRWAVNIVWGWAGFTLFSLAFILALVLLGYFYD